MPEVHVIKELKIESNSNARIIIDVKMGLWKINE